MARGATTSFHGAPAIPLRDQGAKDGALYVAATGRPYILGLVTGGQDSGTILFSDWNTAKVPAAPSGAINIDALEAAGE